jgi:hypothetical protein
MTALRSVDRVLGAVQDEEARGVTVRRPLPTTTLEQIDPFLQIEDVGPVDWEAGEAKWGPVQPMRGFEALTLVLEGDLEITDSTGRRDRVASGDLIFRNTGDGVVVREQPSKSLRTRGGRLHLVRLWVNLSRGTKGGAPTAQIIVRDRLPRVGFAPHLSARVLTGELGGTRAPIGTRSGVSAILVDAIAPGRLELDAPASSQAIAYVVEGTAYVGRDRDVVRTGQAAVLAHDGARVSLDLQGGGAPCTVLFVSGAPLGEPVARFGPFVGATMDEVQRVTEDYRKGKFGKAAV